MPAAFHTLSIRVSHRERSALRQQAKEQGVNLTTLLRLRLGLPGGVVFEGYDPNEIENTGGMVKVLNELTDRVEALALGQTAIRKHLGITAGEIIEMRQATEPHPRLELSVTESVQELAGGFAR